MEYSKGCLVTTLVCITKYQPVIYCTISCTSLFDRMHRYKHRNITIILISIAKFLYHMTVVELQSGNEKMHMII